jgi:hypothetical protein
VGAVPQSLAAGLRERLGLVRAIETGTYRGFSARRLAAAFPEVTTIEASPELARCAADTLADLAHVEVRVGSSRIVLPEVVDAARPTLYWLDGHWSGGVTAGRGDECPLLGELESIASGHPEDCILVDDARLFLAPPPPPHDPAQWPDVTALVHALERAKPGHAIVVAHDLVVCVPARARDLAAAFAHGPAPKGVPLARRVVARFRRLTPP